MVSEAGKFMRGCSVDIPSTVASGPTWLTGEWYGSHELGHTLNQSHTRGPDPGCCDTDACAGGCGCEGGGIDHGRNGDISLSKSPYASGTLYGFDITTLAVYPPDWKENMTYCNPEWISDYGYESIMDRMQWEGAHASAAADRGAYLAVFGTIHLDTMLVILDPFFVLPDIADPGAERAGPYSIRLLAADGRTLADYRFTPHQTHLEPDQGQSCGSAAVAGPLAPPPPALISEIVPWVEGTLTVAIVAGDQTLFARAASPHAPNVTLTSPNGGVLAGDAVTVSWSASDLDGDELTFALDYSRDGGATWQMLQSGLTGQSTTLPLAWLAGTTQGKFRVLASDGVNTTSDVSDGLFSVADKAPTARVTSPAEGAVYVPDQPVALVGQAMDLEDGSLEGESLRWSSDRAGQLGTGELAHATGLAIGPHTITLTVRDSAGHTVEIRRHIVVGDQRPAIYLPNIRR